MINEELKNQVPGEEAEEGTEVKPEEAGAAEEAEGGKVDGEEAEAKVEEDEDELPA